MESKEWLINEYITKKRTCNDIAKELNKDPKTIWSWLRKNEIPTRSRGGDSSSGSFKKGSNLWLGKKHKQETKDKISKGHKGRIFTAKHIENMKLNSARTKSRKVINTETGEIFNTIKEGAESIGMKDYNLVLQLRGKVKNKTSFEYYIQKELKGWNA